MRPFSPADHVDGGGDRGRVSQVDLVEDDLPPGPANRRHGVEGGSGPFDLGQLPLDENGRGPLTPILYPLEQVPFEGVFVGDETVEIGVRRVGFGNQVEKVEGPAGYRGQVGNDRRDNAARGSGHHEDCVRAERQASPAVGRGHFLESDGPTPAALPADLDGAGIALCLFDEQRRDLGGVGTGLDIDDLGQAVGSLSLVGFGEAGDGATHRSRGPGGVVAVAATHAGGAHQECAWAGHLLIEGTHGCGQQLHTDSQALLPAGEVEVLGAGLRCRGPEASTRHQLGPLPSRLPAGRRLCRCRKGYREGVALHPVLAGSGPALPKPRRGRASPPPGSLTPG